MKTIITIGRQYGSGGREIGYRVAKDLGIKLYDKEMLDRAAKESGIAEELFESHDEKPTNSFLYSLVMDTYSLGYSSAYTDMPINYKIFLAQFDAIKKMAQEGPCIFVGRCADYALEDNENLLSLFIHGDFDARVARISRDHKVSEGKAKEMIHKTDKRRASYYNYYTNKKWGDAETYCACLNSAKFGIDGCVDAIKRLIDVKESNLKKEI
ncbi:MAG TPA: cytidylate kinase-like family protein [Candidatus Dorea intestinavium]|nr:cytidylate kinase-like family protein [Candidatus Dorea intestinavium]